MREGDEFYKIEALVSKKDVEEKLKKLKNEFKGTSSIIFEALENNGIKCYEVSTHKASARINPEHITLDVSGNGEGTTRKGFKRHEIEFAKPMSEEKA